MAEARLDAAVIVSEDSSFLLTVFPDKASINKPLRRVTRQPTRFTRLHLLRNFTPQFKIY